MSIRSYGPGKFNTILDSYVYDLTMDSGGGFGDSESFGYYDSVELGKEGLKDIAKLAKEAKDKLTLEECRVIRNSYGAITEENSQGFVDVVFFKTKKAFDTKVAKLEDQWAEFEGDY